MGNATLRKRLRRSRRENRLGPWERLQPANVGFISISIRVLSRRWLALRCGSQKFPLGIRVAAIRAGVYTSVKQGGTLIEYTDEDRKFACAYQAELAQKVLSRI